MTAQGGDLLAWLDRAISEREDAAHRAASDPIASMSHKFAEDAENMRRDIASGRSAQDGRLEYDKGQADALHWASVVLPERMKPLSLHDSESVLRRCAADRKLLELHGGRGHGCPAYDYDGDLDEFARFYNHEACPVVQHLAEAYGWTAGQTPPIEGDRVT